MTCSFQGEFCLACKIILSKKLFCSRFWHINTYFYTEGESPGVQLSLKASNGVNQQNMKVMTLCGEKKFY